MKHFYPSKSGLFQDDPASLFHNAWGLTEWLDEDENDFKSYIVFFTNQHF